MGSLRDGASHADPGDVQVGRALRERGGWSLQVSRRGDTPGANLRLCQVGISEGVPLQGNSRPLQHEP